MRHLFRLMAKDDVTVPKIPTNARWRAAEKLLALNILIKGNNRAEEPRNGQNEGVPPPQSV